MKLKDLLADVEVRAFCGDEQKEITSVAYDSRKVERGSLFICIRGLSADGHDFIQNAIEKGAVAIVAEEAPEVSTDTSMILVPDTRSALAAISATWFRYPARKMT